jgi:aconitase A
MLADHVSECGIEKGLKKNATQSFTLSIVTSLNVLMEIQNTLAFVGSPELVTAMAIAGFRFQSFDDTLINEDGEEVM